ncbi:N-acetylmuramic acid 6-phosphate etherase [Bizionia sediminis]|uniref:N-acetylmuramic acid 6-phosphate etherase n=1 Tax=Bizionia sediminis TaxID=1737064 RepID=A0ABW5KUY8_9FLAO
MKPNKSFHKTTEQDSHYSNLENMPVADILKNINKEDNSVPKAIEKALPQIESLVIKIVEKIKNGGRLFYIGAGTSGRLGVLDASECPPTFGVSPNLVIGIIAGGDKALKHAVENAEDSTNTGWEDLMAHNITSKDMVVGIAASGTTPYVFSALKKCNESQITTASITCNKNSPISRISKYPIEVIVGPEFITGSSRMKAGTAQKLVLNMLTTTSMIQLGYIKDNKMVNMMLSNEKLKNRGVKMLQEQLNISQQEAISLLETHKNVNKAIQTYYERSKNQTH